MKWTDMDHSFCEEHLLGLPEYYNSISSLFIIFFGMYGLMNLHNDIFVDILYASLAIVGVGSTGYHWYGNIGWALFDEIPIIITVFSGIVYTDNVYFLTYTNKFIKENSDIDLTLIGASRSVSVGERVNSVTSVKEFKHKPVESNTIILPDRKLNTKLIYSKKYKLVGYLFGMYLFIINNVMSDFRLIFPQTFTCVVVYLYYKIYSLIQILDARIQSRIKNKALYSLITIGTSGAIWAGTEISCKHINNPILLIGHPMWHFFIGHGFYNLIQVVFYIKNNNNNYYLKYNSMFLLTNFNENDAINSHL
jgi:hypothetical protein